MTKNKSTWPFENAPDMSDHFVESRGAPHTSLDTDKPDLHTPDATSVGKSAAAQIGNEIDHTDALDRHDDRWQAERNRLAHAPSLDFEPQEMANNPRAIQQEYIERRGEWEQRRDQIDAHHNAVHEDIRSQGPTLSDAFDAAAGPDMFEEDLDTLGFGLDDDNSHSR
ncbi:hypothetical protein [Pyruvatibacter mobilis]|uniref:hypothetical protein n=1 Tax=Pyruvatibacter mobilis TaxID=1712261 RepID=UPI003C7E050A